MKVKGQDRLEWLKIRDTEDRTLWAERHRDTKRNLGEIVAEVFNERAGQWHYEEVPKPRSTGNEGELKAKMAKYQPQDMPSCQTFMPWSFAA